MTHPIDCTLAGIDLSSIDKSICILDICEDAPKRKRTVLSLADGSQRILRQERESVSVQFSLILQEPDSLRRQQVYQDLMAWAQHGGELLLSTRPSQRMMVACTALPALHAEDWTETLRIAFTSISAPYWEATEASVVTLPDSTVWAVPGNVSAAPVDVTLTNQGEEAITTLTLLCGATQMIFEGMTLPARSTFTLVASEGVLSARIDGASVLRYRTVASDDLLLAPCGQTCVVSVTADQPFTAEFSARGRYL